MHSAGSARSPQAMLRSQRACALSQAFAQVFMAQMCDALHTMTTGLTLGTRAIRSAFDSVCDTLAGDTRFAYEEDSNSVTFFAP